MVFVGTTKGFFICCSIPSINKVTAVLVILLVNGGHFGNDPVLTHFRGSDFGRLFFCCSPQPLEAKTTEKPFGIIFWGSDGILTRL
jgi:hypothetical protein